MSILRLFILFALIITFNASAQAQSSHQWLVAKITGQAFLAEKGEKPIVVRKGSVLNPGQTLSTGKRTRLLLTRGKERMQVSPGSILAIPPARYNTPGKTLILQQSGLITLSVNKRDVQHFTVRTPFLSAVVKGTTFSVGVREGWSEVRVSSGRVEVSDGRSGATTQISRGQSVAVRSTPEGKTEMQVKAPGQKPKVRKIKSKIFKTNFYATTKVKGKTVGLEPGTLKKTVPISRVKSKGKEKMAKESKLKSHRMKRSKPGRSSNANSSHASSASSSSTSDDSSSDDSSSASSSSTSDDSSSDDSSSASSPGSSDGAGNSENSNANSHAFK